MVLWAANVDPDEFPACERLAGLIVLRIEPLALLPLSGTPHSMYVDIAVRSSRAVARVRKAWIQVACHGGVHRMDCICLFVHWTQGMAVFAPTTTHDAYLRCRVGYPANAWPESLARKANIPNPSHLEQTPNCHPTAFVAISPRFYLCCVLPLHRSDRGHVILEATSRR